MEGELLLSGVLLVWFVVMIADKNGLFLLVSMIIDVLPPVLNYLVVDGS